MVLRFGIGGRRLKPKKADAKHECERRLPFHVTVLSFR